MGLLSLSLSVPYLFLSLEFTESEMTADVTTRHGGDEKKELVTRDLLGGGGGSGDGDGDEKELWEKKLELLSRKSSCCSREEVGSGLVDRQLHDLNLPPPLSPATSFASVCTLEKVKSALEREMRDPNPKSDGSPSSSSSTAKRKRLAAMDGQDGAGAMMVTVCPGCFQYLLLSTVDPTCPKCDRHVPVSKKAKIDLNCSTSLSTN